MKIGKRFQDRTVAKPQTLKATTIKNNITKNKFVENLKKSMTELDQLFR